MAFVFGGGISKNGSMWVSTPTMLVVAVAQVYRVAVNLTELRGYGFAITPLSALQTSPLSGESRSSLQK